MSDAALIRRVPQAMPLSCRAWVGGLMLGFVLAIPALSADAAEADKEAAVRAAFLYRLAFFVSWPEQRFADAEAPIRVCLDGSVAEGVRTALTAAANRRQVNQRRLQVLAWVEGGRCELLYLGGHAPPRAELDPATLVVVESRDTLRDVGQLALVREIAPAGEARLVFHGNRARIDAASYSLSSKLLSLVRFDGN